MTYAKRPAHLLRKTSTVQTEPTEQRAQWRKLAFRHCRVATEVDDRQGLSDVGAPLRHVIPTQVHVLLAVVRLQALNLLPMFLAVQYPAQSAQKADDGQYNGRCR